VARLTARRLVPIAVYDNLTLEYHLVSTIDPAGVSGHCYRYLRVRELPWVFAAATADAKVPAPASLGVFSSLLFLKTCRRYCARQPSLKEISMFRNIVNLLKDEAGATAIEYGLIAALIAVAAVTVMGTVGTNLSSTFSTIATKL
jgi:pilus assembly protein Flp/PilA